MRRPLLIFLIAAGSLLLPGCTPRPRNVLSMREMRRVLYDLHRTDGILQTKGMLYGHDEELARYYEAVLERHGVTQAQFDSSLVWYTDHPKRFSKVYPPVIKRLQAEADALKKQSEGSVMPVQPSAETASQAVALSYEELIERMRNGLPLPEFLRPDPLRQDTADIAVKCPYISQPD